MDSNHELLISALKGLKTNYKISEIIKEFFIENSNTELKTKLNILEKQFGKSTIADYLFNYDQKSKSEQKAINNVENIENKIVFNSNNNIKNEYDDSSSIFKKEKKENNIAGNEGFLNKKKKRELNKGKKSSKNKRMKKKIAVKKMNEKSKSLNNNKIDNYIKVKKEINKNYDYDTFNEEKELYKKDTKKSFLDFDLTENIIQENINEDNEENDKESFENASKEGQNNSESFNLFYFTHNSKYDEPDFYFNGQRKIDGKKTGFGIYIHKDKEIYFKGNWFENKLQGFGIYVNKKKNFIYKGSFVNTCFDGYGKLSIRYNRKFHDYEGEFKKDKLNGFGIYYYNKNKTCYYMGEFKNDKKNGIGISVKKGQFTFECEYKDDSEGGIGILNYDDGDIYKGEVLRGKLEGYGIHIHNKKDRHKGNKYYAFFREGKPIFGFYSNGEVKYFAEFQGLNIKKVKKIFK